MTAADEADIRWNVQHLKLNLRASLAMVQKSIRVIFGPRVDKAYVSELYALVEGPLARKGSL